MPLAAEAEVRKNRAFPITAWKDQASAWLVYIDDLNEGEVVHEDAVPGMFMQSSGTPSMRNGTVTSWVHVYDNSHAYPHLVKAQANTTHCLGVLKDTDGHLISSGFALACAG